MTEKENQELERLRTFHKEVVEAREKWFYENGSMAEYVDRIYYAIITENPEYKA